MWTNSFHGDGHASYDIAMSDKRSESVYVTGQRHMLWTIVAMFAIIWGIPLALSSFGASSQTMFAVIVPLGLAWVLIGGIRSFMIVSVLW